MRLTWVKKKDDFVRIMFAVVTLHLLPSAEGRFGFQKLHEGLMANH